MPPTQGGPPGELAPILFDLDGTLADTMDDIAASANHVRARYGGAPLHRDAVQDMVGDGVRTLLRRALAELRPDAGPEDPFWDEAWRHYRSHHLDQCVVEVRPYPGVRDHLERWRRAGRAMAVVTNKPERFAQRVLDHLELTPCFGALIGGDSLPVRKPDPAPLWAALDRLTVPRTPAVMVGDGVQDLRAGKAAGLHTIAALYGFRPPELLREEGADDYWVCFGGRPDGKP